MRSLVQIQGRATPRLYVPRPWQPPTVNESGAASATLTACDYRPIVFPASASPIDQGAASGELQSARYLPVVQSASLIENEPASATGALVSANHKLVIVLGLSRTEPTSAAGVLMSANHKLVIVLGSLSPAESATQNATLVSAAYSPA